MHRAVLLALIAVAPVALILATLFGSVVLDPQTWFAAVTGRGDPIASEIVWNLRFPRAWAAFVTGALLAVAGVLMQALLRNPLADPYVLGLSGGASVGAMLGMLAGLSLWVVHLFAFVGAVAVALALIAFAARASGWDVHRVLLAGVGFAAASGAVVALLLSLAPMSQLPGMLYWLMGDLSGATVPVGGTIALIAVTAPAALLGRNLDVLALGADKARLLGVNAGAIQSIAFVGAAVATVAAVLIGGAIGFVGIAIPHLLRLIRVHTHSWLIPLAALAGGTMLTVADVVSRSVAAPLEFPVGVATALIGVPVLLWLVARTR